MIYGHVAWLCYDPPPPLQTSSAMKPLPNHFELPDYGTLRAEDAEAALRAQIAVNRAEIERLLDKTG